MRAIKDKDMKPVVKRVVRRDVRYWAFVAHDGRPHIAKVNVVDVKWDYENNYDTYYCKVLETISIDKDYHLKESVIIDFAWQLQPTLEQAIHLLFMGIFSGDKDFFFRRKAPF